MPLDFLAFVVAPFLFALAAIWDVLTYKIPNWIPAALCLAFVPAAALAGLGLADAGWHAATFAAALAGGIVLYAIGGVGAGDAKFFAAAALWMGPGAIFPYLLAFSFVGGGLAVALLVLRRLPRPAFAERHAFARALLEKNRACPTGSRSARAR